MRTLWLKFTLQSDATFGRGDGLAGVLNTEVQHDQYGLPYLSGKTLKGLLCAECAEVLHALQMAAPQNHEAWHVSAGRLFGKAGSTHAEMADLHVGDAQLPEDLRLAIMDQVDSGELTRQEVLELLTTIRRQSAIDAETGAPKQDTLRAARVIVRETPFEARLDFTMEPDDINLTLLAACVKAFRRAGTERHRGRGRLTAELFDRQPGMVVDDAEAPATIMETYFGKFREAVLP